MSRKRRDADLVALMKGLQNGTVAPASLTPRQRKLMVLMIIRENSTITNGKIGTLLGIHDSQVSRIRKQAIRCTAFDVDAEVRELVNVVWMKSAEYQRRAVADNDPRTAWMIFRESIELLQGLGFVFEAPKKIALAHFNGQGDFQSSLRLMFDAAGVPSLPEFMARLRQLTAGGNGNGNGDEAYQLHSGPNNGGPRPGNGDHPPGDQAGVDPGDNAEGEAGGDPVAPRKTPQK